MDYNKWQKDSPSSEDFCDVKCLNSDTDYDFWPRLQTRDILQCQISRK